MGYLEGTAKEKNLKDGKKCIINDGISGTGGGTFGGTNGKFLAFSKAYQPSHFLLCLCIGLALPAVSPHQGWLGSHESGGSYECIPGLQRRGLWSFSFPYKEEKNPNCICS